MGDKRRTRQTANRRQVLYAAAASVATPALAGCSGSIPGAGGRADGTDTDEDGPQAAFRRFMAGFEENDLSAVQEHVHPRSRLSDEEDGITESDVTEYSFEVLTIEVATQSDQRALLNARTIRTSTSTGEERTFWNTVGVRQSDGEWLVYSLRNGRVTPSQEQIDPIPGDGSPEATVRAFVTALDGDDASAYRTTVHPGSRLRDEFTEKNIGSVDASLVAVETVEVGEDRATVNARIEFSGPKVPNGTHWSTVELLPYGGDWRVNELLEGRQTPTPTRTRTRTPTAVPTQTPTVTQTSTASNGEPTATERTDSTAFFEGFEGGVDRWEVFVDEGWGSATSVAHGGESAAVARRTSATARLAATDVDTTDPVSEFSYYWLESSSNFGGGVRLLNADGDVEIGFATDNPQWIVDDADGTSEVAEGDGYNRWIETAATFDWEAGTADVSFRDLETGGDYQESHQLKQGDGVARVQLTAFTSLNGWENDSCVMAWDDISARV